MGIVFRTEDCVMAGNSSLNLTPQKGHKFAQYMEAWNLLLG